MFRLICEILVLGFQIDSFWKCPFQNFNLVHMWTKGINCQCSEYFKANLESEEHEKQGFIKTILFERSHFKERIFRIYNCPTPRSSISLYLQTFAVWICKLSTFDSCIPTCDLSLTVNCMPSFYLTNFMLLLFLGRSHRMVLICNSIQSYV